MRFHQDSSSSSNLIRSYGTGEIKINDTAFRAPVIVSSSAIEPGPAITAVDELALPHAAAVLAHEPEVVLLGTGPASIVPDARIRRSVSTRGSGLRSHGHGGGLPHLQRAGRRAAQGRRVADPLRGLETGNEFLADLRKEGGVSASQIIWY